MNDDPRALFWGSATKGVKGLAIWAIGVVVVVVMLENVPKLGGAVLLLLTLYLANEARKKGAA